MHNAHQLALDDESIRMIKNRFDETLVSALKTIPVILSMTVQFAVGQNPLNVRGVHGCDLTFVSGQILVKASYILF